MDATILESLTAGATLTTKEALDLFTRCANQPRRTYVRVSDRKGGGFYRVLGCDLVVYKSLNTYSRKWVKWSLIWYRTSGARVREQDIHAELLASSLEIEDFGVL